MRDRTGDSTESIAYDHLVIPLLRRLNPIHRKEIVGGAGEICCGQRPLIGQRRQAHGCHAEINIAADTDGGVGRRLPSDGRRPDDSQRDALDPVRGAVEIPKPLVEPIHGHDGRVNGQVKDNLPRRGVEGLLGAERNRSVG